MGFECSVCFSQFGFNTNSLLSVSALMHNVSVCFLLLHDKDISLETLRLRMLRSVFELQQILRIDCISLSYYAPIHNAFVFVSCFCGMEQCTLKNVNNCLNTNIYSYFETSGGQSSNLYFKFCHFFNTSVN